MPTAKKKGPTTKKPASKKPAAGAKKAAKAESAMDVLKLFIETYSRF